MLKIKKLLAILLILSSVLSLAACSGEYVGPSGGGGGRGDEGGEEYVPPVMNDDPTDDFTVTLLADGKPYSPRTEMLARFSDGFSVFISKFDSSGIARIDGLDGDYKVTLTEVPNEYTYDPNSNFITNDDRNIVIELHTLNILTGSGAGSMNGHPISNTGVYAATLSGPDSAIFFMYSPSENGIYTIESWADTEADNVNPYMDVYIGSFAWNQYQRTIDDGGKMGSYTINFVHTVKLTEDQVGNNYIFAVKADSKNNEYPVTVTFAIKRDGGFEYPSGEGTNNGGFAIPTHDFSDFVKSEHEYDPDRYVIANPEYQYKDGSNTYVFDERRFKLWEKNDGGDDFYHVFDEEKYPETDGFGPILYAYITEGSRFLERPFSRIEYNGNTYEPLNSALTAGGLNYKAFIEGYTALSTLRDIDNDGDYDYSYFCVGECTCHSTDTDIGWACVATRDADGNLVKCADCNKNCRECPPELVGFEGYQYYCNSDGLVPVTKELRDFLSAYCMKEVFFYDDAGRFENQSFGGKDFQSVGDSGWLFDCAYYVEK